MYPQGSQQGNPPPPAQYIPQQAYFQQQYQPNPPQYQYSPQPPPKQGTFEKKIIIFGVAFVMVMAMIFIIAGVLSVYMQTMTPYGLKVGDRGDQWMVYITSGSQDAGDVTLRIVDNVTGTTVYSSLVNEFNGSVAGFYDMNENGKLDTGDGIVLRGNTIVKEGMKVELLRGNSILGTIKSLPQLSGGGAENPVGMSVEKNSNGDWLISVNSGGGQNLGDIRIQVTDPNTGVSVLSANINALAAANGTYNDNNVDSKINCGDSLLLKSGDSVKAGMKVQFLKGESIIGTIKELPA